MFFGHGYDALGFNALFVFATNLVCIKCRGDRDVPDPGPPAQELARVGRRTHGVERDFSRRVEHGRQSWLRNDSNSW